MEWGGIGDKCMDRGRAEEWIKTVLSVGLHVFTFPITH